MATLNRLDGFEHGLAVAGVGGVYDTVNVSPTIVTTPVRTGARALELNPANTAERIGYTVANQVCTMAVYVRFETLPTADVDLMSFVGPASGTGRVQFINATDQIGVRIFGSAAVVGGPTIVTGTWYRIVVEFDTSADPYVIRCKVDNGTEFSQTAAIAAANQTSLRLGTEQVNQTFTAYYDDWLISVTDGDYEEISGWTSHEVEGLIPTSDGTHSISGANQMERSATGVDITDATTDAYELVNDRPLDTVPTDYINDVGTDAASYCEMVFENLTSALTDVAGVRGLAIDRESTNTGAAAGHSDVHLSDGTAVTPGLMLSSDSPGVTVTCRKKMLDAPGGTWDTTEINGLLVRCGYGDGAPDVWFSSFMVEVALFEPAAPPATTETVAFAGAVGI
jgi:hypothetical protein